MGKKIKRQENLGAERNIGAPDWAGPVWSQLSVRAPGAKRANKGQVRRIIEQGDELDGVTVGIGEVELR